MRRATMLASAILSGSLLLTACGGSEDTGTSEGTTAQTLKVGLAYDIGGRGDQSFNDSAAAGLDQAEKTLDIEPKELEAADGETDSDKAERLRLLAEGGYNPIIAVGFAYAGALGEVAPDYPDVRFAIVDSGSSDVSGDNIANLVFAEEQGSFLVGAAAALKSTTKNIGFVGGVQTPLIEKFQAGYTAGAKAVDPAVTVQVSYISQPPDFSGFSDPAVAATTAAGMFDAGADIVYQAAGASGSGVFEAASAAGAKAIGVDSDQYDTADPAVRDVILTSMLKNVDVAVSDFITSVDAGKFQPGDVLYDLASDGVGYSTSGGGIDDIVARLDDYKKQIVDGDIVVPTTP